jgi:hypothetical protein
MLTVYIETDELFVQGFRIEPPYRDNGWHDPGCRRGS